jgi:hypothetical protein
MPNYCKHGRIEKPLTEEEFMKGMEEGHFVQPEHRAYVVLLYYSGVRKTEGSRVRASQFYFSDDDRELYYDVGKRLKGSKTTPVLKFSYDLPYMMELATLVHSRKNISQDPLKEPNRIFDFCPKTAYNIVARAFPYPHLFRLSRITNFFLDGFTLPRVRSWTGLSHACISLSY